MSGLLRTACTTSLVLLFLLTLSAVAQAQFTYITTNGTITITEYTGPGGAVTIPDTIAGLPVTSIGEAAFNHCTALASVTIPNSVISIGVCAFCYCPSLTNVTIPDSVTYMGSGTFEYCGLTSVTIGHSLTNIADTAFGMCPSLTSVTIPNGVTSIGVEAFDGCGSLTNVSIPHSVTSIGDGAFCYCPSLTSITLPNSVTSIGDEAFWECTNLTAIYCWGNAPIVGLDVFDMDNIATVFYLSGTSGWGPTLGSRPAVVWNPAGGVYIIRQPQGVATNVGATVSFSVLASGTAPLSYQWWKGTTSLTGATNMTFRLASVQPADAGHYTVVVTDMGGSTTSQVAILDVYAMPPGGFLYTPNGNDTVTITGYTGPGGAVYIPDTINGLPVIAIGDGAFYSCTSLTSLTIPDSVTSIGIGAFQSCSSLTNLTIPNRVTSIGGGAFSGCSSLTNITIPDSVTSIGENAFSGCFSLTHVTIPNRVTSVGQLTFQNCFCLTSVTIPDSVTSIADLAFDDCTSLAAVYFLGNAPQLAGQYVFYNDDQATVYYLPGTTGWGTTFAGRPTALCMPPAIQASPQTQTAEAGAAVRLRVDAGSSFPLFYFWYLNATNLLNSGTDWQLDLPNLQLSQSGAYTVVISNVLGAITSAPAILNVIAPVERRPVPGVKVTGQTASLWNVDCADSLIPAPKWTPLGSVSLTGTPQYYFDVALPLPRQRFYRAWQTGAPGVLPSLDLHLVSAITLTGAIGHSVRLDYINQFGPTDAWVTLGTVTLTNTSQLYFDISAPGQPPRLYRLVQSP